MGWGFPGCCSRFWYSCHFLFVYVFGCCCRHHPLGFLFFPLDTFWIALISTLLPLVCVLGAPHCDLTAVAICDSVRESQIAGDLRRYASSQKAVPKVFLSVYSLAKEATFIGFLWRVWVRFCKHDKHRFSREGSPPQKTTHPNKKSLRKQFSGLIGWKLSSLYPWNSTRGTQKEFGQTVCPNCFQLGLLGWVVWGVGFSPLSFVEIHNLDVVFFVVSCFVSLSGCAACWYTCWHASIKTFISCYRTPGPWNWLLKSREA